MLRSTWYHRHPAQLLWRGRTYDARRTRDSARIRAGRGRTRLLAGPARAGRRKYDRFLAVLAPLRCPNPPSVTQQILDQIIGPFDLSHDFGRKGAYEAALEYARQNLIEDPHCNEFLLAAAKRLGFAPVTRETLEGRVKLPKEAWLDLWISDEDDEVALTGTREGIQYLIDLLTQLRDSSDPEQHIHLDRGSLPMTENSANLVLFKEEESWFTGVAGEGLQDYPQREIDPKTIYAIQFIHYPPDDLPISAHKLYRVMKVEEDSGTSTQHQGVRRRHREPLPPLHLHRRQRRALHLHLPPRRPGRELLHAPRDPVAGDEGGVSSAESRAVESEWQHRSLKTRQTQIARSARLPP